MQLETTIKDFLDSPVVKTQHFHCHGPSSIPGQGTKILQALWHGQNKQTIFFPFFIDL